jgi:hypothetical protein
METGVADHVWSLAGVIALLDYGVDLNGNVAL